VHGTVDVAFRSEVYDCTRPLPGEQIMQEIRIVNVSAHKWIMRIVLEVG